MPSRPFLSSLLYFGGLVISALECSIYRALAPALRGAIDHAFDHSWTFLEGCLVSGSLHFSSHVTFVAIDVITGTHMEVQDLLKITEVSG